MQNSKGENSVLIETLRGKKTEKVPFWYMRQAGRYLPEYREVRATCSGFTDLCLTPEKAEEVTLQPLRRFDMDAAILFSDILMVPHGLGQALHFAEGEGPKLEAIEGEKELEALNLSSLDKRLSPIYETVRRVRKALPENKALIGFAGSPWTVACYMLEGGGSKQFEKARRFALASPDLFQRLLSLIEEATLHYLSRQVEAGADCIQLFDSWAGVLSAEEFDTHVVAPTKRLVSALKKQFPWLPVIGFPRSAGVKSVRYVEQTGVNAVGTDSSEPLCWMKENLSAKTVIQGNLDPLLLALDKNAALAQAERILKTFSDTPFIFNLGHGFVPYTPTPHVEALSALIRGWKR